MKEYNDFHLDNQHQIQFKGRINSEVSATESDIDIQKFAAETLANLYDNCADILDEYNKNRGLADVGTYVEKARKFIDWATFGNIKSTSHIKDDLRAKSNELKNINHRDSENFRRKFKELSGVEYNEKNIKEFMELVNKGECPPDSDKFKESCFKAFGLKGTEKQEKYVKRHSYADGIGDIALMLITMGVVSKSKMMGNLTSKLYKTLEKGAEKILPKSKTDSAAKIGTSMIMGGSTLAGYTLTKESLDNLSNPTRDASDADLWKQTGIAALESFGFGAFGGLLNETAVAPLVKHLTKPAKQVSQAVGIALSDGAELSGKEIMKTALKSQEFSLNGLFKMNGEEMKALAQNLGAHGAGFGVEVLGFAGYEAGLDAIKDICNPDTKRLPDNMTLAELTKYLGEKIGDQFNNLGTIKGVSQLIMMSKGGRTAQTAMMNKMVEDSKKLSDVKFKKVSVGGNDAIEMTMPDGTKKNISNPEQALQSCQALMQIEFIINNTTSDENKSTENPTEKNPAAVKEEPAEKTTEINKKKVFNMNQKLSIEQASDSDLKEIHKIDIEAFDGRYNINPDFERYKADLEEQNITTYSIKGEDGSVIGYYQLEPVENGELYIYSIGIQKELRNSRISYKAIKQTQEEITKLAKEQNVEKVVLDVDSAKPELVKLYKKFGFEVTGESKGTEDGHPYHDYRMEANVKEILAKENKKAEITVEKTEEIRPAEEKKPEEKVATIKRAPFFEPQKTEEGLTTVKYGDKSDFKAKIFERDGKQILKINNKEHVIEYTDNVDYLIDLLHANQIYSEAGFHNIPQITPVEIEGRRGYITEILKNEPDFAIERLSKDYGVNIFTDNMKFVGDGIVFNKNGKEIKLQTVKENDTRLSGENTAENTVYITENEMLDTMQKFASLPADIILSKNVTYQFGLDKIVESKEDIFGKFTEVQRELRKSTKDLRVKMYPEEYNASKKRTDEAISQGIENVKLDTWHQRALDTFLEENIEERYKEYDSLRQSYSTLQKAFKQMIAQNPDIKPYLAEIKSKGNLDERNYTRILMRRTPDGRRYDYISTERAAAIVKLMEDYNYVGLDFQTDLEKTQHIPSKFFSKCVFEDNINDPTEIIKKWDSRVEQNIRNSHLSELYEMEPEVENEIIRTCMDEYGELADYKIDTVKKLLRPSSFGKKYSSYSNDGPYSVVGEIMRACDTKEKCKKVTEVIIPTLQEKGFDLCDKTAAEAVVLLNTPEKGWDFQFDGFEYYRKEAAKSDYENRIKTNYSPERLQLIKDLKAKGFDNYTINNILLNHSQYSYPLKFGYNPEAVEFLESLVKLKSEKINPNQLSDSYGRNYMRCCETGDYEGKQKIVESVNKVIDLVNDPSRTKEPLTVNRAVAILQYPEEEYKHIHDMLFWTDSEWHCIPLNGNDGKDFYTLISLAKNETTRNRFYQYYAPVIEEYPCRDIEQPYFMERVLTAKCEEYYQGETREIQRDFETNLCQLKYLLENTEYKQGGLMEAMMLEPHKFERLPKTLLKIESLGENQLDSWSANKIAHLPDNDYALFKEKILPRIHRLCPNKCVNGYSAVSKMCSDYLRLEPEKLDKLCDIIEYFNANATKMEHQDMEVTPISVSELLHEKSATVLDVMEFVGDAGMKYTLGMRYKGLKAFLESAENLTKLEPETRRYLISQLGKLPHPEQKLEKLSVISALIDQVDNNVLEGIISRIESPEMTKSQKELADKIFEDKNKSYEEQIEDFIQKFNVPKQRKEHIRSVLHKLNLQERYVTPPPIEKQLEIIDKKIDSVNSNEKIPQDKKQIYLESLKKQRKEIEDNPKEFTRARINDTAMKELEKQVEAYINLPNQKRAFNKSVNKEVYKVYGIPLTDGLLNADVKFDPKYFAKLFEAAKNTNTTDFKAQFKKMMDFISKNPDKKLSEVIDLLPHNQETRKLFEAMGLDYDRWIKFDENSYYKFTVVVEVDKAVKAAKDNLMAEFESELAKKLNQREIANLVQIAKDMNIENAGQKDLPKIINEIEKYVSNSEYWKTKNDNDIKTFKDHLKIHKKNIRSVEKLKNTTEECYVRLWDNDDVGRNLFFGNHVGCCTQIGSWGNSFAAPQHLMNSFVRGIEIVDKSGNSMGNSMCYFAKIDGKLTFVIDSFEATGKLGAAPEVTDAIIAYSKQVCAEMGQPEANVMFGPNYNKLNFKRCVKTQGHTIEVIGRAPENTYIDCIGGKGSVNAPVEDRPMFEIIDL